jgi:hypothetical protein
MESGNSAGLWLNLCNLSGNYFDIFKRHSDFLAVYYSNHLYNNIETHSKLNKSFNKIKYKSEQLMSTNDRTILKRYKGKALMKVEKLPKILQHPERLSTNEIEHFRYDIWGNFDDFILKHKTSAETSF